MLVIISDTRIGHTTNGTAIDYYNADVVTASDYHPFGMTMPGRKFTQANTKYRYGFNGKENDNEVKGEGNQQDYGMRIYDPRLGRFLSTDPLAKSYPMLTPYQFASNSPIAGVDLDGLEFLPINSSMYRMMTTEHTALSFTTEGKIKLKTYQASQVATQYKNIPDVLKDASIENFKFVSGGIVGTNGQDRNSETDGPVVFDPSRYHVQAQFYGAAFDGTSTQDIASLRGNAIPGKSAGNNGGALGKNGIGIFKNAYFYSYNVALGDESKNRNRFYDATNIVDDYLNKNSIKDATLTGVSGRNSLVNFLTDGTLPTDGLNTKDLSFEQLENSLRVAYSGYQILLQKGIGTQPGLSEKVTPLNEEYTKRGGKLNFSKANDFNKTTE